MPRIQIPITRVSTTAVPYPVEIVSDPVNLHYLPYNDGNVWMEVRNTEATVRSFTMVTGGVWRASGADDIAVKDPSLQVPASSTIVLGPFIPWLYNQVDGTEANGIHVNTSVSTLRFRAFHLGFPGRPRFVGGVLVGTRVEIPTSELYTEEHLAALLQPAYIASDPTNDHRVLENDGRKIIEINNLAGAQHDVTFTAVALGGGLREVVGGPVEVADVINSVPAGAHMICGGFDPDVFNQESGLLQVNVETDQLQFRGYRLPRIGELQEV